MDVVVDFENSICRNAPRFHARRMEDGGTGTGRASMRVIYSHMGISSHLMIGSSPREIAEGLVARGVASSASSKSQFLHEQCT
jgi:hypothetical protein